MSSRSTLASRPPLRRGASLMAACALAASAAGLAHAQETPHQSTPPERHMTEPPQNSDGAAGQNVQNGAKNPGDRMAPASKVEGTPQKSNNNEATQQDIERKEQQEKPAGTTSGSSAPPVHR